MRVDKLIITKLGEERMTHTKNLRGLWDDSRQIQIATVHNKHMYTMKMVPFGCMCM